MNIVKATKKNLIGKANSMIFIAAIVGSVSLSIGIVSGKILLDRHSFQLRIMREKKLARDTLRSNVEEISKLKNSLTKLDETTTNSQVILEALPSKYDFPAVASSLELIAEKSGQDKTNFRFSGKDEGDIPPGTSTSPVPYPMPFTTSVKGSTEKSMQFLKDLERSIRPINIKTLALRGEDGGAALSVTAETYYQPTKDLQNTTKEVK